MHIDEYEISRALRAVVTPVALLAPALLVYVLCYYFNLHATEPVGLMWGLAVTYVATIVLGFGGHTFFETLYVSIFLTIFGGVIIGKEFPSFWSYAMACLLIASWYNLVLWKLGKVSDQPAPESRLESELESSSEREQD